MPRESKSVQRSQNRAFQAETTARTEILRPAEQVWSIPGALELNDQGRNTTRGGHRGRQGALQARARIWDSIPSERPEGRRRKGPNKAEGIFQSSLWFL